MENTLLSSLKEATNYKYTENGAVAHKSTLDEVYDLFAFGGAYRKRSEADCILLFKNAFEQDESMALKCLFYLRDIRGGQGERRFFRICFKWLCDNHPEAAKRNLDYVSEFGRWDDLIYTAADTKLEDYMLFKIKEQLVLDLDCKTPSLLGKWLPSENASSYTTTKMANKVRKYLKMTHKQYRKVLSSLRTKINIVEKLMSENRWDEIEFDKIPSRAGLIYRNAFARRDLIQQKYKEFIKSEKTTVNTKALYPYDVVHMATKKFDIWGNTVDEDIDEIERMSIEKYWNNLPNYCGDKECNMLCVCDTSGSMDSGTGPSKPINVAIALSMYAAERAKGPFQGHYISFSSRPSLISIEGVDFVDKVARIYRQNLCENTNINLVFDLLKDMVLTGKAKKEDLPETIIILSDMQIDSGSGGYSYWDDKDYGIKWTKDNAKTEMENIRIQWEKAGLKMPKLIYWCIESRDNTVLDCGPNVTLCSGASPILFEQIMQGVTGLDLMKQKLLSDRYKNIK